MRRWLLPLVLVLLGIWLAGDSLLAQRSGGRGAAKGQEEAEKGPRLPDDPKLLELHKDFVLKAEKLAKEYEREDEPEKARVCYEEILRLVPGYPKAEAMLAKMRLDEATADHKSLVVHANRGWQDTGVDVIAGKPVAIRSAGTWTFRITAPLSPDGMAIPEELRDFNLGSLIGAVVDGDPNDAKPFFVGSNTEFVAETSGRLILRMYDSDPEDNAGKLEVEILGTFEH